MLLFSLFSMLAFGQVEEKTFSVGSVQIVLSEERDPALGDDVPFDGSKLVHFKVLRSDSGEIIHTEDVHSGPALGGYSGVLLPSEQPIEGAFIFQVEGDYNTRLFAVSGTGQNVALPYGAIYQVSPALLAVIETTAVTGSTSTFTLLNTENLSIAVKIDQPPAGLDQLDKTPKLYLLDQNLLIVPTERSHPNQVGHLNLDTKTLVSKPFDKAEIQKAKRLPPWPKRSLLWLPLAK